MQTKMDKAALEAFIDSDFAQVKGLFEVDHLTEDGLVMRMPVRPDNLRPGGTVSGPSMFALADVAIYLAILRHIGPVALAVTTNASIDFMRKPVADKDLLGEARLLKLGRVLAVGDVLIRSEGSEKVVARASMTYSIPPAQ